MLWADLQDLFRRTEPDFDPTVPGARAAWEQARGRPATGLTQAHRTRRTS